MSRTRLVDNSNNSSSTGSSSSSDDDDDNEDDEEEADEEETTLDQLYAHKTVDSDETICERMEWQQMLQSVLMGELVRSEKKRILFTDQIKHQKPVQDIWLSIRALLRGRTFSEEVECLKEGRKEIDEVLKMVLEFKVRDDSEETPLAQVAEALKTVDRVESLYSTRAEMISNNPGYADTEFQTRLDALNAWCTITRSLEMQYKILRDWTCSEDLQIARKENSSYSDNEQPSFIERLLKESALQDTFDKRTLSALYSLLVKSKQTMSSNNDIFIEMNLPSFTFQLRQLASFPTSLVEEALKLRLEFKDRIDGAPEPMIDTMMDDYRGLLTLACRVKLQYEELANPAPGWDLKGDTFIDESYDTVLLKSMRFYFRLIAWKLRNEKENTLKQCEVMEKEWEFLRSTVCQTVKMVDAECAEQFW